MKINKVNTLKLSILDGLEIKSAMFINKNFPLHFHLNWSLAFIEFGCENISFNDSGFSLNNNSLVLIPPYSMHKNWGNKNSVWNYKAIYINNDVIRNVSEKINIDYSYLASFPYFITYSNAPFEVNEASIFKILENLFSKSVNNKSETKLKEYSTAPFNEILNYLSLNYNESISLDVLEKEFKMNKFKLQKNFKNKVGLTPLEYQTSIRIENSKKLFYTDTTLVEIALEAGF